MPVIQLPRDTRFGELGDALGKALGGAITAYQDNQTVSSIMQDPTISEADKPKKLITIMGALKGATGYADWVRTQLMQSQIQENLASAGLKGAQAAAQGYPDALIKGLLSPIGGSQQSVPTATPTQQTGTLVPTAAPSVPTSPVADVLGGTAAPAPTPAPTGGTPTADVLSGKPAQSAAPTGTAPPAPLTVPPPSTAASPAPAVPGGPTAMGRPTAPGRIAGTQLDALITNRAQLANTTLSQADKDMIGFDIMQSIKRGVKGNELMGVVDRAIKLKQEGAKNPYELSAAQSNAATAAAGARTAEAKASVDLLRAAREAEKLKSETQSSEQRAAATRPIDVPAEQIRGTYPSFTDEQVASAKEAGMTGGTEGLSKEISRIVQVNTEAARRGNPTAESDIASIGGAIASYQRTMDTIERRPDLQGGFFSGVMKPYLAAHGYDFFNMASPDILGQKATSDQLALSTLQGGHHGLGGSYLVPYVNATMPSGAKEKLFQTVEAYYKAVDFSEKLQSMRLAAIDKGQNTGQIDDMLAKVDNLKARAGSVWWTGEHDGQPSRVFYRIPGEQVAVEIDPRTWEKVPNGAREYAPKDFLKLGDGSTTGAQINELAKKKGQTPEEAYATVRRGAMQMPGGIQQQAAPAPAPVAAPQPTAQPAAQPTRRPPPTRPSEVLPYPFER